MDHPIGTSHLDRRTLLGLGAGLAAGALISTVPGEAHAASTTLAPRGRLTLADAKKVRSSQFIPASRLATWGKEVDDIGLRATGSPQTEMYLRMMVRRLRKAGLSDVRLEPVPMERWLATSWSITVNGRKLPSTFYMPYTQQTPVDGLTAEMVLVTAADVAAGKIPDVAGKIAVFEVTYGSTPIAGYALLSYPGAFYMPDGPRGGSLSRPYGNNGAQMIEALTEAGAAGLIGIWPDLPGKWARQYTPYDGVFRPIPGLWVDSVEGPGLQDLAGNGATATITLQATTRRVLTHNVVGFIPGRSKELTVLHTHTDGTNGMEENGQIGIIATAQYLARLPKQALQRSVMVMLSTGHFAGGVGIKHFLDVHAHDLVPRMTSIITLEHLGTTEWQPNEAGVIRPTGRTELGSTFAPNAPALVKASIAAEKRVGIPSTVIPPYIKNMMPEAPKHTTGWPGEGVYWWLFGGIPTSNYITGPYGLLTADLKTKGMVDYTVMRRTAMSTVRTVLELASASKADLVVR